MMIKLFLSIAIILLASTTAAAQGSFNDGVKQGKKDAERQWRNSGSDCGNIFGFQKKVDRDVKKKYPQSSNWRTDSYNRGARSGADEVVTKYEKKCLEDNPDECTALGDAAAQGEFIYRVSRVCKFDEVCVIRILMIHPCVT
jgi:hypothetical protein